MEQFFNICNLRSTILFCSTADDGEVVKKMKMIPDRGTLFPSNCKQNYTESNTTVQVL